MCWTRLSVASAYDILARAAGGRALTLGWPTVCGFVSRKRWITLPAYSSFCLFHTFPQPYQTNYSPPNSFYPFDLPQPHSNARPHLPPVPATRRLPRAAKHGLSCDLASALPPVISQESPFTNSFRMRTYAKRAHNQFRIRAYKTQDLKPFRMNTYKKTGGGGTDLRHNARTVRRGTTCRALFLFLVRELGAIRASAVSPCGGAWRRFCRGRAHRDRRGPSSRK